jgi:hypothetical protein
VPHTYFIVHMLPDTRQSNRRLDWYPQLGCTNTTAIHSTHGLSMFPQADNEPTVQTYARHCSMQTAQVMQSTQINRGWCMPGKACKSRYLLPLDDPGKDPKPHTGLCPGPAHTHVNQSVHNSPGCSVTVYQRTPPTPPNRGGWRDRCQYLKCAT